MKTKQSIQFILSMSLVAGLAWGQSFFDANLGSEVFWGSGKSVAMGKTSLFNDGSAAQVLLNPAGLAIGPNTQFVSVIAAGRQIHERRGIDLMDTFGDFLTTGDYVSNEKLYPHHYLGWVKRMPFENATTALGISHGRLISFDYSYSEEVRGRLSLDDGVIGIKDPIIGYHILETEGVLDVTSAGLGLNMPVDEGALAVGLGVHWVGDATVSNDIKVEEIQVGEGFLSYLPTASWEQELKADYFVSISGQWQCITGVQLAASYQSELKMERTLNETLSTGGYRIYDPVLLPAIDTDFVRPARVEVGLAYRPVTQTPMSLVLSLEQIDYGNPLRDVHIWKFGFEYLAMRSLPVRAGMIFQELPVQTVNPISLFTFGTGRQIGNLQIDLAGTYGINEYQHHDLFPVDGDVRPDYDRVKESQLQLILGLNYAW